MKRTLKIVSLVLVALTLFLSFVPVIAGAEESEIDVLDMIEENIPGFDETEYTYTSGTPHIIGVMEQGLLSNKVPKLFVYVYNPYYSIDDVGGALRAMRSMVSAYFYNEKGELYEKKFYGSFTLSAKSDDGRFYIFEAEIPVDQSIFSVTYSSKHVYQLEDVKIRNSLINYDLGKTEIYRFIPNTERTQYTLEYEKTDFLELDVKGASYTTNYNTDSEKMRDTIYSVYFSIPTEHILLYDGLYSVTSSFTRKKIENLVLCNILNYGKLLSVDGLNTYLDYDVKRLNMGFISSDYVESFPDDFNHIYVADDGYNLLDLRVLTSKISYVLSKRRKYMIPIVFEGVNSENLGYKNTQILLDELEAYYNRDGDIFANPGDKDKYNLYVEEEYYPEYTKTVEDSFTIENFIYKASLEEIVDAYGFKTAFEYVFWSFLAGDKKQDYWEDHGVVEKQIENAQNLVVINPLQKNVLLCLSDSEISNQLLIAEEQVPDFRDYLEKNESGYVAIYRVGVEPYYSEKVVYAVTKDGETNLERNGVNGYLYDFWVYDDFEVIRLTYNDDGGYTSVGVTHDPIRVVPGIEYFPPTDPINSSKGFASLGKDFLKYLFIALGVVAAVVAVLVVVNLLTPLGQSISNARLRRTLEKSAKGKEHRRRKK